MPYRCDCTSYTTSKKIQLQFLMWEHLIIQHVNCFWGIDQSIDNYYWPPCNSLYMNADDCADEFDKRLTNDKLENVFRGKMQFYGRKRNQNNFLHSHGVHYSAFLHTWLSFTAENATWITIIIISIFYCVRGTISTKGHFICFYL